MKGGDDIKVIIMMGIPGSGKTTWIDENLNNLEFLVVISPDDLRHRLCGNASDQSRNTEVFEMAHARLKWLLLHGDNAVWDATNLKAEHREQILMICKEYKATTQLVVMGTPYEVCCERNAARLYRVVPDHAMERMEDQFAEALGELDHAAYNEITYVGTDMGKWLDAIPNHKPHRLT